MEKLKITITNIQKYVAKNVIIFEVDSATGIMEADYGTTYESFDYLNWYHNSADYKLVFSSIQDNNIYDSIKNLLNKENAMGISEESIVGAVGSIEFTERYLGNEIKAINIPKELRKEQFTGRYVAEINSEELDSMLSVHSKLFIKDLYRTKKNEPFICNRGTKVNENIPKRVLISEVVDFMAEYRAFVYRGQILDCKQYLGDYRLKYNQDILEEMVNTWVESPTAYSLDIGVLTTGETVIVEAHSFLCCGLYGFSGDKLAYMTLNAFREEKIKK